MKMRIGHIKLFAVAASVAAISVPALAHATSEPVLPAASCSSQQSVDASHAATTGTWVSPAGDVEGGYGVALPTVDEGTKVLAACDAGQSDVQIDALLRAAGIVGAYLTPARGVEGGYSVALPIIAGNG